MMSKSIRSNIFEVGTDKLRAQLAQHGEARAVECRRRDVDFYSTSRGAFVMKSEPIPVIVMQQRKDR